MILSFIHSMHKITESELQNANQGILVPHFYNMMHTTKLEKKKKKEKKFSVNVDYILNCGTIN